MSEPDVKRLKKALDNDATEELVEFAEFYSQNWDMFRYLSQFLTVNDIVKLCSVNRNFKARCDADVNLQRDIKEQKLSVVIPQEFDLHLTDIGYGLQLENDFGTVYGNLRLTNYYEHYIDIALTTYGYEFNFVDINFKYTPNLYNDFDNIDFNILKRIWEFGRVYIPNLQAHASYEMDFQTALSTDRPLTMDIIEFRDYVYSVIFKIGNFLIDEGFDQFEAPPRINSCVNCNRSATLKCEITNELFCSKKCAEK